MLCWFIQVQYIPFNQRKMVEECQAVFGLWQDKILTCFKQKLQNISMMKYSSLDIVGACISGVILVDRGLMVMWCLWCVLGFRSQKVQEYLRLCHKGVSEWRICSVSRRLTLFWNLIIQFLLLAIHCNAYVTACLFSCHRCLPCKNIPLIRLTLDWTGAELSNIPGY